MPKYMLLLHDNTAAFEQAVNYARDCPQLDDGGTIEVRQVDVM